MSAAVRRSLVSGVIGGENRRFGILRRSWSRSRDAGVPQGGVSAAARRGASQQAARQPSRVAARSMNPVGARLVMGELKGQLRGHQKASTNLPKASVASL